MLLNTLINNCSKDSYILFTGIQGIAICAHAEADHWLQRSADVKREFPDTGKTRTRKDPKVSF